MADFTLATYVGQIPVSGMCVSAAVCSFLVYKWAMTDDDGGDRGVAPTREDASKSPSGSFRHLAAIATISASTTTSTHSTFH